jgi:glycine C-acetyltransferase
LEKELAEFVQKSAYLLNFGYQGMVSTIDALVSRNDVIVYDMDSHACIVDGVRLHWVKDLHTSTTIWKVLKKPSKSN